MRALLIHGLVAAAAVLAGFRGVAAQLPTGLTPSVESRFDPTQRYGVYVPTSYQPGVPHPLVLVLDMRGRAMIPLERMVHGAEELGYIVMSSYDTRSDEDAEPNERAVRAMIEDAQDFFTIDPRRLYFAGISGTARESWLFAEDYRDYTAGILGFGATLPSRVQIAVLAAEGPVNFAYFGGAGDIDYNYEELRALDWRLDDYEIPHFVQFYPGPHEWPADTVLAHALEWMEVRAVRDGRSRRSPADLEVLRDRRIRIARALEAAGDVEDAWRTYQDVVVEFDGLVETEAARLAMARLAAGPELERANRRLRAEVEARWAFHDRMAEWIERVETTLRPQDVAAGVSELQLRRLQAVSRDASDTHAARAAQRKLEDVFVHASFYQPRKYMPARRYEVSRAFFEIALMIKPGDATSCLGLARTSAQRKRLSEALEALSCVARAGALTLDVLDQDPLLDPLRADPRFAALRAEVSGR